MTSLDELEIDHLAIGLTKPAMRMGVPMIPFFMSILLCFFGWMFYQAASGSTSLLTMIVFALLWCVVYFAMLYLTFHDPFGLKIVWINLLYFRKHQTHVFWGHTDSYKP